MYDPVREVIRVNLGKKALQKIEGRLLSRYNISVNQGLLEFEKLDEVLREFFGEGAAGLEENLLKAHSRSV